jgi:hypothetical protein
MERIEAESGLEEEEAWGLERRRDTRRLVGGG